VTSEREYTRPTKVLKSAGQEQDHVFFGQKLTRKLRSKNVKFAKKVKTHKPKKKTLEPHEVPTKPWQVVGNNLFSWCGDKYLLMSDYYSKKMPCGQSTSSTVASLTECVFSDQGVPEVMISDNGPHQDGESLQGILQGVGCPTYYVKSHITKIRWIHGTTSSDCQTHFREMMKQRINSEV